MAIITRASKEWAERPPDERFSSLEDLHAAVLRHRQSAAEAELPYKSLSVGVRDEEPVLVGPTGATASFTNWSFGQLSARVQAPAGFLGTLKPETAANVINEKLVQLVESDEDRLAKLYFARNGEGLKVRALTSPLYQRVFDADVTERLLRLVAEHPEWQPAPAAFDGSRGLYASDHDVFAFLVDNGRRIFEKATDGGLSRGVMFANSEVGDKSFWALKFYYEYVCGNHIVWGASDMTEFRIRHVGEAEAKIQNQLVAELRDFANESASEDEAKITNARKVLLGGTKDEVLDKVFGLRIPLLGRKRIEEGFDRAAEHDAWYGDPKTVWGFINGLTEVARDNAFGDERVALDRAAGKVLQIAF